MIYGPHQAIINTRTIQIESGPTITEAFPSFVNFGFPPWFESDAGA